MQGTYQLSSTAITVKKYIETKLWKQAIADSFFSQFMGKDSGSLVQVKTNLEKGTGKGEVFTIRKKLKGKGVTGRARLEGNEEALETASFETSLELYRHATSVENGLTAQYDEFNMPQEAQDALKDWMSEKIDDLCFDAIYASHTNNVWGSTGSATSVATLTTSDKLTPTFLRKLKIKAKLGIGRTINPLLPIKYKGRNYYILLCHDESLLELKEDTTMQQYLIHAMPPGWDNPIFSGAEIIYEGMVLMTHERVFNANTGGSGGNVPYAKNLLLGAQSLLWTWGKRPRIIPMMDDYEMISKYAIEMIGHADKPKFDSLDYNSMCVYTSRTIV